MTESAAVEFKFPIFLQGYSFLFNCVSLFICLTDLPSLLYAWFCMNLYQETPKEVTTIDTPIVLINLHYTRHNKATKVRVSPAPSVIITTSSVVTSLLPPHILTVTVTQGRMLTCSQNCNQWKTNSLKTKNTKLSPFYVFFTQQYTKNHHNLFQKA